MPHIPYRPTSNFRDLLSNTCATTTATSPQALLDQLAGHALDTPSSLTPLRLSCVALAHHAHLQFTGVGLLDQVKVAAGRSGDAAARDAARADVAARLRENPAAARSLFAHAAMLRCLLNRFTFE